MKEKKGENKKRKKWKVSCWHYRPSISSLLQHVGNYVSGISPVASSVKGANYSD